MRFFVIINFLILSCNIFAVEKGVNTFIKKKWDISKTQLNYLTNGKVIVDSDVSSIGNAQTFNLKASALHSKKCSKALRKLSRLENYQEWISFIKTSTYQEKSHLFTLTADHPLLPHSMLIHIIVERPTKPGRYNFTFPTGMFQGLRGYFEIAPIKKRCLFYAESHWSGKKTRIPDFAIEIFSETLSKLGGEILMRKTK